MNFKHSAQVRLPNIKSIKDPVLASVLDQFMRLVHDSFKNIYDDMFLLSKNLRHKISSASTLTLEEGGVCVYTGAGATTWTLPELSRENELYYFIKNRGSGTITLQRSGTDEIYDTTAVTSISITAGESYLISNDGSYWIVFDLN